jgi:hypothetical protein
MTSAMYYIRIKCKERLCIGDFSRGTVSFTRGTSCHSNIVSLYCVFLKHMTLPSAYEPQICVLGKLL